MKKFLKIAAIISILLTLLIGGLTYLFITSFEEDKGIAYSFVKYSSTGAYEQASELMHDTLKKEFPIIKFQEVFKTTKPIGNCPFNLSEMPSTAHSATD